MIGLAAKAAAISFGMKDDIPKQYQWVTKCDFDQEWENFEHFPKLAPHIKSRDQCMAIGSYMFTIADVNHDLQLTRCEHTYGCVAAMYKEGQNKKTDMSNLKKCVKGITKHHKGKWTLEDVGAGCAKQFPTLKGSPLPHD